MVACLRWFYRHILLIASYSSQGRWVFVFITTVHSMIRANDMAYYDLKNIFACLHITPPPYHQYLGSSEGTDYEKCLPEKFYRVYILSSVVLRLQSIFHQSSFLRCTGLCVVILTISHHHQHHHRHHHHHHHHHHRHLYNHHSH